MTSAPAGLIVATGTGGRGILDAMTTRATSRVLVGRDTELGQLRDAFKRARADEPVAVLVGGEAGVGKTRLVEEFRRYAEADDARVLVGQCLELGEDGLPFAPFAAILRDLLRRDGVAAFAGYEQELARLLPELAAAVAPGPPAGWDSNRGHLFEVVSALVERLAADRPLVLVVEDLHWADRSTRDLIRFLVRSVRATRSLLVGTYRSDELHRGHPLRAFLAELDRVRSVERLDLDRLDRDGTAQILHHLLDREPPASMVEDIHARAQGNPFFIEELAGCADDACGGLPDNVRDLLLARVDQLPEAAQRVLRIAAAGGNPIGHRLLAEVAGVPEVELEDALRAAVAAQLLVPDGDGEAYEFRHALVREAVHDDLLPGQHTRLHARYAAAIEARPELVGGERAPAELAHHWYLAHDHPRALTAAVHAAVAAQQRYAYAEQSRLLDRVLALWDQVPDAAQRAGMPHLDLLIAAVEAANEAGNHSRALSLNKAALAEIDPEIGRDAKTGEEATAPLRAAQLLVRQAKLLIQLGKSDGSAALQRAYELSKLVDDGAERAGLVADVAFQLAQADREAGGRLAREAAELARRVGDPAAEVRAAITSGHSCAKLISAEQGLAELARAQEIALATGDRQSLLRILVNTSDLRYEVGDYAESARVAESGLADSRQLGMARSNGIFLLGNLAEALVALGRFDEAEARCTEAARLDPPGTFALLWMVQRAQVRLTRGHPGADQAVARAVGFLSRPYLRPSTRLPLQELRINAALAAGDLDTAVAVAAAAVRQPRLTDEPRYAWPLLAAAARAAAADEARRNRPQQAFSADEARRNRPQQAFSADEARRNRPQQAFSAAGDAELRERVAATAGTMRATYPAERAYAAQTAAEFAPDPYPAWRETVTAWRADGQPYPLARALLQLAEAAAGAGDRPAAAEAVAEAGQLAATLDAVPLAEQVQVLARRLGVRVATAGAGTELLTSRELEVLRLVAAGHSNRRIAGELFISPKTASVHVSRIIAKLAVANRVEAAAVAHRLGLLSG
jgi:predicted ATPase/DNA-binding CsgD family transcriptional regulator